MTYLYEEKKKQVERDSEQRSCTRVRFEEITVESIFWDHPGQDKAEHNNLF